MPILNPDRSPYYKSPLAAPKLGGGIGPVSTGGAAPPPAPKPVNFQDLINNDPVFGQIRADVSAGGIADAAQRAAAIRRALVNFGEVPDVNSLGLSDAMKGYLGSDVDQATRDLAAKNTQEGLSLSARLSKAHADALRALKNGLAARGMLQSGELGHGLSEEALRYKQGTFDARQQLLDTLLGVGSSFAEHEADRRRQLAEAMAAAAQRQLEMLGDTPAPAAAPPPSINPGVGPANDPDYVRQARLRRLAQLMGESL